MWKKKYGCGLSKGMPLPYIVLARMDPQNITFGTLEPYTLQHDLFYSVDTYTRIPRSSDVKILDEFILPEHAADPLPMYHNELVFYTGSAVGHPKSKYFRLVSTATVNKSFDAHSIDRSQLWADKADVYVFVGDNGVLRVPHNKLPHTLTSKQNGYSYLLRQNLCCIAQIYLSSKEGSFENDGVRISINEAMGYVSNHEFDVDVPIQRKILRQFADMFYPQIRLPGETWEVESGGTVVIPISVQTASGESSPETHDIYLKSDCGYLPKNKLRIEQGEVAFKVVALGLDRGDTINLKAGFKYYSGDASMQIRVQ